MKSILPLVISIIQSAFVLARSIHDNVIIAFETVHSIRIKQTSGDPKCVDISKTYGMVQWIFLQQMMLRLGFDATWVALIRCVNSFSFSTCIMEWASHRND